MNHLRTLFSKSAYILRSLRYAKTYNQTNWHHIVVTSYQLAVQDSFAFKRKRWYYLILDEAHNIKNFQSQRWQTLISFNTQRRLLLTGTPLQVRNFHISIFSKVEL